MTDNMFDKMFGSMYDNMSDKMFGNIHHNKLRSGYNKDGTDCDGCPTMSTLA